MLIDYHLHNHFSPDSGIDTRDLVRHLRKHGIRDICITNHGEWFVQEKDVQIETFDLKEVIGRFKLTKKEIDEVQREFSDMCIGFGLELQYDKHALKDSAKLAKSLPFDFILGSVHFVDDVLIASSKYCSDLFTKNSEQKIYTTYFEDLLKWVKMGLFDVVAHFDVIKKTGFKYYGPFNPQKYKSLILKILREMKKRGIGIELNTRCLHERCNELFPHPDILKWCLEIGIEHYTLGSDAHDIKDAGAYLDEALWIAKDTGIKTLSVYRKRKPEIILL